METPYPTAGLTDKCTMQIQAVTMVVLLVVTALGSLAAVSRCIAAPPNYTMDLSATSSPLACFVLAAAVLWGLTAKQDKGRLLKMWGMWFLPAILGLPGVCALTYWVLTVFTHITHLLWTAGVCQFASAVGIAELVKDTLYFLPPLRLLLGIWYIPNALVASAVMLSYYTAIGTLWAERTGYLSPVFESSADPCLNIHPDTITEASSKATRDSSAPYKTVIHEVSEAAYRLHSTKAARKRIKKKSRAKFARLYFSSFHTSHGTSASATRLSASPRPSSSYTVTDSFGPQGVSKPAPGLQASSPTTSATSSPPSISSLFIARTLSNTPIFSPSLHVSSPTTSTPSPPSLISSLYIARTLSNIPNFGPTPDTTSQHSTHSHNTTPSAGAVQSHSTSRRSGQQYSTLSVGDVNASLLKHYSQSVHPAEAGQAAPLQEVERQTHDTKDGHKKMPSESISTITKDGMDSSNIKIASEKAPVNIRAHTDMMSKVDHLAIDIDQPRSSGMSASNFSPRNPSFGFEAITSGGLDVPTDAQDDRDALIPSVPASTRRTSSFKTVVSRVMLPVKATKKSLAAAASIKQLSLKKSTESALSLSGGDPPATPTRTHQLSSKKSTGSGSSAPSVGIPPTTPAGSKAAVLPSESSLCCACYAAEDDTEQLPW